MHATDGDGKAAQNMLTLKKKVNIPPPILYDIRSSMMAKITLRTSVPSNGRIFFLPRIYEFYIGAWFCLGVGGGGRQEARQSSILLSMEVSNTLLLTCRWF